jgi:hypothetical protein
MPTVPAVINTPRVDNEIPCHKIGFTLSHFVSNPPEKRIKVSATTPKSWAMCGSLK